MANKNKGFSIQNAYNGSKRFFKNYSYVASLVLVIILGAIFVNDFFSLSNLTTIMLQATIKGVLAIGITFVITCNMFDLSGGSIIGFTCGLGIMVYNSTGSFLLMLAFCIIVGGLLGSLNGFLVTLGKMPPFIATLATSIAFRSIISQIGSKKSITIIDSLMAPVKTLVNYKVFGVLNFFMLIFIVVSLIGAIAMYKTKFGKYVTAIGSSETAARLSGINVTFIKVSCFVIAGATAGLSAFLLSCRLTSITAASAGDGYHLDAIAAVAIGGTKIGGGRGKIWGTFFGAIILLAIEMIITAAKIPAYLADLVKGCIIIAAVLLQTVTSKSEG